ncbi:glucoamylase family protein [Collimonas fungivorans]|uniref:Glucoamylase family protein n=1 Tax=Collimonas fungivorans TaxID=158899 RepID=A0A127PAH3_9BURK|nr:glucoamylase family protein [Collimonas fungivorans]AMO94829.1 glucoamylase family protein [Collimonas fungivorans]
MKRKALTTAAELDMLQRESFSYFMHETNLENGLVVDKTATDWPASIAAVGLALAAYPVAVERGFIGRAAARKRVLLTLRFFWSSPQGPEPDATGYKGFFYHFLHMQTGRRAWQCELSTIDTTFFLAGALAAGCYFDDPANAEESEIRRLADALYLRVDWQWAQDGGGAVSMGWKPESGFLPNRWDGYDEALLLYILGLGSPSHPLPPDSYCDWAFAYQWQQSYGIDYFYAGSLFTHQLSHIWVDFRGIQDGAMRTKGIDYFENSRRATLVQQQYAIANPGGFSGYGEYCWGITASDGPGPSVLEIKGVKREFYDYVARGVPHGPDDGTIAPWVVVASLPFAPEIVLPTIDYFVHQVGLKTGNPYGFKATFNPSYPCNSANPYGWISPWHFGIDQGPIILMIENYRSEMLWSLMRNCPYIANGLRRAGFSGGWLGAQ